MPPEGEAGEEGAHVAELGDRDDPEAEDEAAGGRDRVARDGRHPGIGAIGHPAGPAALHGVASRIAGAGVPGTPPRQPRRTVAAVASRGEA